MTTRDMVGNNGPVTTHRGRLVPNPKRPASLTSQALLLDGLRAVSSNVEGVVLDVGCGRKPYASLFDAKVERYIGCDWPPATSSLQDTSADVFADAMILPFADSSFDSVVCTEVLEHLPDPRRCVAEIARVLKPDGAVLLSVPFVYWIHEYPRDYFRYTPNALELLLSEVGLEITDLRSRGGVPSILCDLGSKWFMFLARRIGRKVLLPQTVNTAAGYFIVATQRAFLLVRRRLMSIPMLKRATHTFAMGDFLSLGYVLIARHKVPAVREVHG